MIFEVEFAAGLLPVVRAEVQRCIGQQGRVLESHRNDSLQFTFEGHLQQLLTLRTVIAVYSVVQFDIPRPKALLGHEHFHRLLNHIRQYLTIDSYQSLYISAAGSESSVMLRIKEELAQTLSLVIAEDEGDLLLRIRRTPHTEQGWDVLVRLTPRPLATRDWRVCNFEGALNASIAAAIIDMTNPTPEDHFLNIACGSGTMLIERALHSAAASITGIDLDRNAISCAKQNINAANVDMTLLSRSDAIQLPFASAMFTTLVADLPFGQLLGSHDENEWLYPAILNEAARITAREATFIIITHEIKLMKQVLEQSLLWRLSRTPQKVTQSGLHPRIYVLERL